MTCAKLEEQWDSKLIAVVLPINYQLALSVNMLTVCFVVPEHTKCNVPSIAWVKFKVHFVFQVQSLFSVFIVSLVR